MSKRPGYTYSTSVQGTGDEVKKLYRSKRYEVFDTEGIGKAK